jgi:4-amino-4-deoxy-L-arabinose transferase-like glycosyltransferase
MARNSVALQAEKTRLSDRTKTLLAPLFLVAVALPLLLFRLGTFPAIWFDEGYKLNAARVLAQRGMYASYTVNGYIPFDPGISSGPLDVAAVALSLKLLGQNVVAARLPSVVFSLIAVLGLYAIGTFIYGQRAGFIAALVALAAPPLGDINLLILGRQTLGEPAALALMLVGLWLWFKSWESRSWRDTILAGVVIGVGMLSKNQIAIPLVPALFLIGAARWWKYRTDLVKIFLPLGLVLTIFVLWMGVGALSTPPEIRAENSALTMDAIRSNLITDLFGRNLNGAATVIVGLMAMSAALGAWTLRRNWKGTPADWALATITVFVAVYAVWFALLSIGWPRYAYAGLVVAMLPLGKAVWDIFTWLAKRVSFLRENTFVVATVVLTLVAVASNLYPALRQGDDSAQRMADYISTHVPPDAVVETWEWELDGLSTHWQYHHPAQSYLFLAIRQQAHKQPFNLEYDVLQANPDYLVTGPFSGGTLIYNEAAVGANFQSLAKFGPYEIFQRKNS